MAKYSSRSPMRESNYFTAARSISCDNHISKKIKTTCAAKRQGQRHALIAPISDPRSPFPHRLITPRSVLAPQPTFPHGADDREGHGPQIACSVQLTQLGGLQQWRVAGAFVRNLKMGDRLQAASRQLWRQAFGRSRQLTRQAVRRRSAG